MLGGAFKRTAILASASEKRWLAATFIQGVPGGFSACWNFLADGCFLFFPTCQVRVVRFYQSSCPPPPPPHHHHNTLSSHSPTLFGVSCRDTFFNHTMAPQRRNKSHLYSVTFQLQFVQTCPHWFLLSSCVDVPLELFQGWSCWTRLGYVSFSWTGS